MESYSHPILELIEWETTPDHNSEVLNDTIDYYRYFDATKQAEFLFDCVMDTINRIIPEEVNFIYIYNEFKRFIDDQFEMLVKLVSMLVRFFEQNGGTLSKRASFEKFPELKDDEVEKLKVIFRKFLKIVVY